jgi:hypothetical protein
MFFIPFFKSFYLSGLCIYFHSPETLTNIQQYYRSFIFLLNILVLEDVENSFSFYKLHLNQFS